MILIYTHKITNRVQYSLELVFETILGLKIKLTSEKQEFADFSGPKISYCYRPVAEELHFAAVDFLFQNGIEEQELKVFDVDGYPAFFKTNSNSELPFDVFALSFYLVSRYEEYLPHIRDVFDRFDPKESIAYKNRFIKRPLVNLWAQRLKVILESKFPDLDFKSRNYQFLPTLDVDNAFAYRQKGVVRTIGASLKYLFKFQFSKLVRQLKVVFGLAHDPYDTFEHLNEVHAEYKLHPIYFFLVADYGFNDKNVPIESRSFQSVIKSTADEAEIGIHPGYVSNENVAKLEKEIKRLAGVIKRDVTKSRQHFLKLTLPETYRNLIHFDMKEDYTMGYAATVGFRASICTPFYFYDLDLEVITDLKVYPFCIMDASLKFYYNYTIEEAKEAIDEMVDAVRQVDGTFISLWHNESLSDEDIWVGWRSIYSYLLEKASEK
ncbi:polysaccharide deacetylase family protein [Acidiluteibacter ferrifornacis]|uniref:DUF7033 domain-containing protein n=1 Tax=Acidiluteibacter ferrifornacis TaxID=2692424 RepID=A0A6N9NJD4_9FLAO|nr:polysaccharide deacetylase family protein [Acidiluteibacter ferrifornacis]NBG66033.1 hypothetical protein [Acidiluteibacter ferrifornacis]